MKKKLLSLILTLVILISSVAVMGMTSSAILDLTGKQTVVMNPEFQRTDGDIVKSLTFKLNEDGKYDVNVNLDMSAFDPQFINYNLGGIGYNLYDSNNNIRYYVYGSFNLNNVSNDGKYTLLNVVSDVKPGETVKIKVYLAYDYYADDEWRECSFYWVEMKAPDLVAVAPKGTSRYAIAGNASNLSGLAEQCWGDDGVVIDKNIEYNDKDDAEPYEISFASQGDDVFLDLRGHTVDITTRAKYLFTLDYPGTRLHIINSKPETPAKLIMRTKTKEAAMFNICNSDCSLFVYDGVELVMGEKGDQLENYTQSAIIYATDFNDIALYGGDITNNINNGFGVKLDSDNSNQFNGSTFTVLGGSTIKSIESCFHLSSAYDYPKFKFGPSLLDCGEDDEAFFHFVGTVSSQVNALTFADIVLSSGYSAYNDADSTGGRDGAMISNDKNFYSYKKEGDIYFRLSGINTCDHYSKEVLFSLHAGHYTACKDCGKFIEMGEHTGKATVVPATEKADGRIVYATCDCGFKVPAQTVAKIKTIKLSTAECTYNGKTRSPSVTVKDANGKVLVNGTDYDVTVPSGRKNPGIYKYVVTFKGNYEGTKTLNFTINPKTVDVATIKATQSTSVIKLTWGAVEGATGYRVYQYSPSKGKFVQIASVKGVTSYRKATNLKAGTEYKFKIKAYTKTEDGTVLWATASKEFLTATECKAPSITSVTSPSKSKATVKWSNVDGETGFQLYYSTKKDSGYKKVDSYSANKLTGSKTFSSSASGKTIYFKVRAYHKVNGQTIFSEWSAVKSVKLK